MALSNTAVPIYYGKFRDSVLRGEIAVNEEISLEMNRIDSLIADPRIYYDDRAINGFIAYCENELTLTDGTDLNLLDSFKLWSEQLFAWFYFIDANIFLPGSNGSKGRFVRRKVKKRLVNKQFLIVGRGAAKSMYASCIQSFILNIDTTTTHQIATAPTMKQSEEVLSPIRTSITRARGPVFKFLTRGSVNSNGRNRINKQLLASTKKGIENFATGSLLEIRPMRIDKLQGLRVKIATVDEWLSGDIREDVVGAIEQGASKVDDWIILAISSEGNVRNGPGDAIKMELKDILKGEYYNPHVSIWHYKLDDVKEVSDPNMWIKANPNLGHTVSYETYQREVDRAEKVPAARNDILAKRFGIALEGLTYFFTYEETLPHQMCSYYSGVCALGIDLSRGDDFCSFSFLFPMGSKGFGIKTLNFITDFTYQRLQPAMKEKYREFIAEGSLIVLENVVLDLMQVYDIVDEHIQANNYDVRAVGYDPYNAETFITRWVSENGLFGVDKVIQGARTESVPLGELKQYAENRMLLFDQQIMMFSMGNSVVLMDNNGNRKLHKDRRDKKIDCVSATMDAYVVFKRFPEMFE